MSSIKFKTYLILSIWYTYPFGLVLFMEGFECFSPPLLFHYYPFSTKNENVYNEQIRCKAQDLQPPIRNTESIFDANIDRLNDMEKERNENNTNIYERYTGAYNEKEISRAAYIINSELYLGRRIIISHLFQKNEELIRAYNDYYHATNSATRTIAVNTKQENDKVTIQTPIHQLRSHTGIGRAKLRHMIIRHPDMVANLLVNPQTQKQAKLKSTTDILREDLNVTERHIQKIAKSAPGALRRMYRLDLREKLTFLRTRVLNGYHNSTMNDDLKRAKTKRKKSTFADTSLIEPQVIKETLRKIVLKNPQILSYSIAKLEMNLRFFTDELGLSPKEITRLVKTMPLVLTKSVDNKLRTITNFLYEDVGCSEEQIQKICVRSPHFFSLSLEKTIIPKVEFLRVALFLKEWDDMPRLITMFPGLLHLGESNINTKIEFLMKELELNQDELRDIVVTNPSILGLSIEGNLYPKINFLLQKEDTEAKQLWSMEGQNDDNNGNVNVDGAPHDIKIRSGGGGLTRQKLKEFILYQPALLAYSLDNRIAPRLKRMHDAHISLSYSPLNVLNYSNDMFDKWLSAQSDSWTVL